MVKSKMREFGEELLKALSKVKVCEKVDEETVNRANDYLKCLMVTGAKLYASYIYEYYYDFETGVEGFDKVDLSKVDLEDYSEARFMLIAGMNEENQIMITELHGKLLKPVNTPAFREDLAKLFGKMVYQSLLDFDHQTGGKCSKCPRRNECDYFAFVRFLTELYFEMMRNQIDPEWIRMASEAALFLARLTAYGFGQEV